MPSGTACCSVACVTACDCGTQDGEAELCLTGLICVPLRWTETSFIAWCLSNTCTHVLQRCTWEQHSMRKWSRRKPIMAVKAEGDGLCRVSEREVWSPFLVPILAERGCWRVRRQGGGRMSVLHVSLASFSVHCCFLGWLVKAETQVNTLEYYSIFVCDHWVVREFYFLYLLL